MYDVKPAGETFMHVGIKEVCPASPLYRSHLESHRCQTELVLVCRYPEGLSSDPGPAQPNLQHHPGSDGRQAGGLCARSHGEGGEI